MPRDHLAGLDLQFGDAGPDEVEFRRHRLDPRCDRRVAVAENVGAEAAMEIDVALAIGIEKMTTRCAGEGDQVGPRGGWG